MVPLLQETPRIPARVGIGASAGKTVNIIISGLKINTDAQVLDTNGSIIPGLYAAGETTGGVHGGNRIGGNAVCDFVVFGRIAGSNASAYAAE